MEASNKAQSEKLKEFEESLKSKQQSLDSLETELKSLKEKSEADNEEKVAEIASIRERLNEAIQERWLTEEKIQKLQKDAEKEKGRPSGLPTMAEIDAKDRELRRKIQDLEGEAKRAKMDAQDTKKKMGDLILKQKHRDDEILKMKEVLKDMTQQILDLERDLETSENACDEYEALVEELRAKLSGN